MLSKRQHGLDNVHDILPHGLEALLEDSRYEPLRWILSKEDKRPEKVDGFRVLGAHKSVVGQVLSDGGTDNGTNSNYIAKFENGLAQVVQSVKAGVDVGACVHGFLGPVDDNVRHGQVADALGQVDAVHLGALDGHVADLGLGHQGSALAHFQ